MASDNSMKTDVKVLDDELGEKIRAYEDEGNDIGQGSYISPRKAIF
jgi:hypothetical protein